MPPSIPVASVMGTSIRLHWTFLSLLAFIVLATGFTNGAMTAAKVLLLVCLIFASVVLHEFAHITAARKFGIKTPEVVLLPIGGLAKLERIPTNPKQELVIAIAGPVVNFLLFGLLVLALGRWPSPDALRMMRLDQINYVEQLAIFNLVVGLFNLLPAFPMDGGRIFRALLALALPHHEATRIAARLGQMLAIALGLTALMIGNVLLIAIAAFIFLAAASEARIEKIRHAIGGTPVQRVMVTGQATFALSDPIGKAADALLHSDNEEFPVLSSDGKLAGFLLRSDILESMQHSGAELTAGQVMRTDIPIVPLQYRAEKVAEKIAGGAPIVGVVDSEFRFAGLVNWRNLLDALAIGEALKQKHNDQNKPIPSS